MGSGGGLSWIIPVLVLQRKGSSASIVTTHGLIEVQKLFEVKGSRGTNSHVWMSLADQSFNSTRPVELSTLI